MDKMIHLGSKYFKTTGPMGRSEDETGRELGDEHVGAHYTALHFGTCLKSFIVNYLLKARYVGYQFQ